MRLRPIAILSLVAASVVLAGCASEDPADDAAEPSAEASAPDDLCDAALPSGDAIESVEVSGKVGEEATVSFEAPLEPEENQRVVITEGDGDELQAGDVIRYGLTVFDAETGKKVGSEGYDEKSALPVSVQPTNTYGQLLGCATPGTRIAFTAPGQTAQDGTEVPAQVFVLDYLEKAPSAAWGDDVDAPDGFPAVDVDDDGVPTVTVPDGFTVPDATEIATIKQGDGAKVGDGDYVLVQYEGVKVSDGEEFDSSWSRGTPASFQTSGVIEGFTKALVGQKVGSRVIAVIPKAEGYGGTEGHELQDEDLIFVVDILGTQSVPAA